MPDTFARDVRVAFRVLNKDRSFIALAVVVMALGICAVTTMFAVVNGAMLRGFSFPNAERMTSVRFIDPTTASFFGADGQLFSQDYVEFVGEQRSFELMTATLGGSTVNITANGQARRYTGAYVTEHFFRVLGVGPVMGRDFTADDNRPGADTVLIISHGLWQRDFGAVGDIVGTRVRLNGKPATIVGVMPQGFSFPDNEELWIPLFTEFPVTARNDPQANNPNVIGLIRQGVSIDQAQAEFTGFAQRFAAAYPDTNTQFNAAEVEPLIDAMTPAPVRGLLLTMLAFCVGVLLIACVNVMNMQFARATLRGRELAVRSSLGATRLRLVRQMLTESLLVAVAGAIAGSALAYLTTGWIDAAFRVEDNGPPRWMVFTLDGRALFVAVAATVVAVMASGLLPAWIASRTNPATALADGGRGNTGGRIGMLTRAFVVFQIVTTCVLLIGSILQARSIVKQQSIDYGYDTAALLSARVGLMDADYPTAASRKAFYDRLLRDLRASGQFDRVAFSSRLRMTFGGFSPIEIEGRTYRDRRDRTNANMEQVSDGYFALMGQRLIEGRDFTTADLDGTAHVAIVNADFAQKHFGRESALGRRFRTGDGSTPQYGPWRTIVGVVSTVRMIGPGTNPRVDLTGFYVPFYATPTGPTPAALVPNQFATVLVTPPGGQSPAGLVEVLRREVARADPHLPLYFVGTPAHHLAAATSVNRVIAIMFSAFGVVAVVLSAVGLYGVMSFAVSQRTQEFGVRMALGADQSTILSMVLRQGSRQIALGLGLGLALSLGLAQLLRDGISNMLFGVSASDPLTYASVTLLVLVVSVVAVLVPAQRATRVQPMSALRLE